MTVETLSSNVVNYLVWRYLQEAGYGNAALQLSRCWVRDPEALPFAKNVSHYTLVNLLQDGLLFDKYQAQATGGEQRYHFGADHGRPYSSRNGEMLTLDEGIPAHQLAEEANANGAIPEPAPKKGPGGKRRKAPKTNGIEARMNAQVNGDAMDIDQNGSTHVTNSVRADSEAAASDVESPSVDIPISTLSIGQSTEIQTEKITDLAPNTSWASIADADKVVEQTLWGTPAAPLLLTAGKSLLRLHLIPKYNGSNSAPPTHTLDLGPKLPMNNFIVTAVCWNTHADLTVSAQEELVNEGGEVMKIDKLFRIADGGQACDIISSTAGFVTTLRWNEASQMLLSISTDGQKGYIKIWTDKSQNLPEWTTSTDTAIYDAVWIGEKAFVVCGAELFQKYEIADQLSSPQTLATHVTWETLKFDAGSGIIAAMGMDGQKGVLGIVHPSTPTELRNLEYPDLYLSGLDFQSRPNPEPLNAESQVLLATSAGSGITRVWDANQPFKGLWRLPNVDDREGHAVVFSPDGALLATAGPDAVTVWELGKREVPVATWRAEDQEITSWNASVNGEFSLGWEPDSSRLSIALGNQVAIITVPR
ncbi:hypothetical protein BDV96DRAFT_53306 [Lophiotrema nucula]|uniref:Uncharacterized protein n=1 Tax=Lophiotrema nucula TaxID=690887 RepID=A0A6A5Z857_9PLEO|nr:hypothetical protein BDV96DRAFT_53306 [Lophiotrema nucula]